MLNIFSFWNKRLVIILIVINYCCIGCEKMVEVDPPVDRLTPLSAFGDDNTAISIMTAHFAQLSYNNAFFESFSSISRYASLSADELQLWSGVTDPKQIAYYTNTLYSIRESSAGAECWPYDYIYSCNTVIEGVNASKTLSPQVKNHLLGEAKFMRALYFFYLTNFYGDIPLTLVTDFAVNRNLARSPKSDVYKQIIADLKEAQSLLSADFLDAGLSQYPSGIPTERVRPTKWAATALLSRVYLYTGYYADAIINASTVIENTTLFNLVALNDVFKANSRESIWQLQTAGSSTRNTGDGAFFIPTAAGPTVSRPVYLSNFLLNSFEPGDDRKTAGNWTNNVTVAGTTYHYPFKYKMGRNTTPGSEYLMMLRLGEQYLIRAEARAQQDDIAGAVADINIIRTRARAAATIDVPDPLPNLSASITKEELLAAILHERQVELFTEWGHRWLDLKRTGKVDEVMSVVTPLKGGTWQTTDQLYPLPYTDILSDPNLIQNPGY